MLFVNGLYCIPATGVARRTRSLQENSESQTRKTCASALMARTEDGPVAWISDAVRVYQRQAHLGIVVHYVRSEPLFFESTPSRR
jgi:hypothetical protein